MKLWQIVKRSLVTYTLLLIMVDLRYLGLNGNQMYLVINTMYLEMVEYIEI